MTSARPSNPGAVMPNTIRPVIVTPDLERLVSFYSFLLATSPTRTAMSST
jgi:hypothetical protein